MAIEATYILNSHIKSVLSPIDTMEFYPGITAPEGAGKKYILYVLSQGRGLSMWMVHNDIISYTVVHTDFDKLHKMVEKILETLEVEDPESIAMTREVGDPNVRYQHISVVPGKTAEGYFSDQSKYFYVPVSIMMEYTIV